MRKMMVRSEATALTLLGLSACNAPPDMTAVKAQAQKPIQRYDNFLAVASNGKVLAAAGTSGVLVTSHDQGGHWQRQVLAGPASIVGLSSCADGSFAAVDFYKKVWTGDAEGKHWQPHVLEADFSPLAIHCDAQNRIWVAGSFSTVLSSQDQGKSWSQQALGEDAILTSIQFVDDRHGFIAGEFGTLLVTDDGGAHWNKREGLPAEFYPYSMAFADAQHGWMSGLAGAVLQTSDGGRSWQPQSQPAPASLYALFKVGNDVMGVGAGGLVARLGADRAQALSDSPKVAAFLAAGTALSGDAMLVSGAAGALQLVRTSANADASGDAPSAAQH